MEQLWKKELRRTGANYVDCFKKIDEEQKEQVYDWLRQQCKRTKKRKRGPKPKPGGQQPISHDRVLRKRKLAEPTEVPSKQKKIDKRRRSQKAGINRKANGRVFSPKLSFKPHDQFPDIANVLEIKHDEQFGRHVVAKCNIEVGQIIAKGEPFADAVVCQSSTRRSYCLTCKKIGTDFIDCENCADVKFCSEICRSMNRVHHLECNSIFHHIDSLDVKLTIQMILIAIKGFSTADKFIRHCETLLANDSLCKNGLMLRLTQSSCGDEVFRAYKAYQCLMTMQSINKLFSTLRTKRFLMHLVLQYTAIVPWNNWTIDINDDENFAMRYIHDAISLFNHSCCPNAFYGFKNNQGFCLAVRPIRKGEQVFINYLGDRVCDTRANRQSYIKNEWGFECACERCKPKSILVDTRHLMEDRSLKYIKKEYDDYLLPFGSKLRNRLTTECANFLKKHGHTWTRRLDNVITHYLLTITHEQH